MGHLASSVTAVTDAWFASHDTRDLNASPEALQAARSGAMRDWMGLPA
jgi:hypothetical protein